MTEETINEAEAQDETPVQKVAPSETNLTIQDLTTCMQIIAVCGSRGAIKADEMAVVGTLYNKLFAFLDASGAIKRNDEATAEAPAEEASDESEGGDAEAAA